MRTKVFKFAVVFAILIAMVGCAAGGPAATGTATTKTVAEDILFYARVYQNAGKITDTQFAEIQKAYDSLKVAQDIFIDTRVAYLKMPTDITAEQKYQQNLQLVLRASTQLIMLAYKVGLVKDDGSGEFVPPIRR